MTPPSPTAHHVADDQTLDEMFDRLLAALRRADPDLMAQWRQFEACLRVHMDDEEQRVTPVLAAIQLREALAILQEHRYLRARLKEIGDAIGRGDLRLVDARSFRDELRAHAHHENAILRRLTGEGEEG